MMRDHALQYAAADGWPVFPCAPGGKEPAIENGFLRASTIRQQIMLWWRKRPNANIGFCPGSAGLIVVDIDGPDCREVAIRLGLFAEPTRTVITPRGEHLYFTHPGGKIGNRKLGGKLDIRADRGYVLLPPSVHPSGDVYRWQDPAAPILELPPSALAALRERPVRPAAAPAPPVDAGTPRRRAYVTAAIEAECLAVANTPDGSRNRNNQLNASAYSLARFVETGEADAARLADALALAGRHAGLTEWEVERTIASAFRARGVPV